MRKVLICGVIAGAAAAPALAQEATLSGNITLATDYTFRGLSQTDNHPAVQGGLDASIGSFYVGTWASNVDFGFGESIELDVYGGYKFAVGPVALDVGVIGYLYPQAADDGISQGTGELDYYEGYVKGSVNPANGFTLGGAAYYSPEFTGETGDAYYLEINGAYAFGPAFSVSGAYGYQNIDNVFGVFGTGGDDSYSTWNLGGTYSNWGLGFDLRYVGTSVDATDPIVVSGFTTEQKSDGRVIFSVKKAM
jgi:uncharacterized protein (TIGR02001 family)